MASKPSLKHPYAAIEHRVIDSPAYADLSYAARSLLVLITRQLNKNNNGHLQATFTYMERFGLSVNTLSRATRELITHGMIYKSKSGGFHQGAAQFAVTWLPVTNKAGIFMQGFQSCAWREWLPTEKKSRPPKVRAYSLKNGERTPPTHPKSEATPPPKSEHNELCHVGCINSGVQEVAEPAHGDNETEYIRESESDLTNGYWEDGEFIKYPVKQKQSSPKVESMVKAIERLKRSKSKVRAA
jgi:hypothetical protein